MKVSVCLKRVPDTATKVRIASNGCSIETSDVQYVISPYDEFAIEEAIRLKEHAGEGTVTVVSVGPDAAQQSLRQALAMGADAGILILSQQDLDPYQVAKNLAEVLRDRGDDIVFFGRQAVDDQGFQVGPMTARLLGIPCITDVVKLEIEAGRARVEREVEGAKEIIETLLPAAFTAQKGLNEPRYASLKGIMAAKKKLLETLPAQDFPARLKTLSLALPPPRPEGIIVGEGPTAAAELVRLLRQVAKAI